MIFQREAGKSETSELGSAGCKGASLRVLFVTADDPLHVVCFFEELIPAVPDSVSIVGVTVLPAFQERLLKTVRRVLRLYGPVDFARLCLRFAGARMRGRSISRLTKKAGIPLIGARSVNSEDYLRRVAELAPDVIVSVAAPEIFSPPLLSMPRLGCLNVHSGRLPAYRGMMPVFWQLLKGETAAVVTVHEMVEAIDAGRVLDTVEVPLNRQDRLSRAMVAAKRAGAVLLVEVLDRIRRGCVTFRNDGLDDDFYRSFPEPEHVRTLRAHGHRML